MSTKKTFTVKTDDELDNMTSGERYAYMHDMYDKINHFNCEVARQVRRIIDAHKAEDVIANFKKNYVGKWMYAEHGIGNHPTMAYVFDVRITEFNRVELDMIHYSPELSRFPIHYQKEICDVNDAEQEYDNLSKHANMYNDEKEYVEDYEACKKMIADAKQSTMDAIRHSLKNASEGYDRILTAINDKDAEMFRKEVVKLASEQPLH